MDRHMLDQTLQQLHSELRQIQLVDANDRQKLQRLMADIQALLNQKEEVPAPGYARLAESLRENIKQFEVSHPTVTGVMDRTINMLARMGI